MPSYTNYYSLCCYFWLQAKNANNNNRCLSFLTYKCNVGNSSVTSILALKTYHSITFHVQTSARPRLIRLVFPLYLACNIQILISLLDNILVKCYVCLLVFTSYCRYVLISGTMYCVHVGASNMTVVSCFHDIFFY